jgi:hypothetical protein
MRIIARLFSSRPPGLGIHRVLFLALVTLHGLPVSWHTRAILCTLRALHHLDMFQTLPFCSLGPSEEVVSVGVRRRSIDTCNHIAISFPHGRYKPGVPSLGAVSPAFRIATMLCFQYSDDSGHRLDFTFAQGSAGSCRLDSRG